MPATTGVAPQALLERIRRYILGHPLSSTIIAALTAFVAQRFCLQMLREPDDNDDVEHEAALAPPEFVLDGSSSFYAFLFSPEGVCIAHGGDPANVGKTLAQVFQNEEIEDASALHERFMRTAAAGGGWCAYSWRSPAAGVRLKGAYIVGVKVGGKPHYAGVGYMLAPPQSAGRALGLYGFVCTGEGKFIAHGGSADFIGQTLGDVVSATGNHLTDAGVLLERFTTAARLGGGFVEYSWRNHVDAPLLVKGAQVLRVELGTGCTQAAAAIQRVESERNWSGSYSNLAALAEAAGSEVEPMSALATTSGRARTLFCGVGYFGGNAEQPEGSNATLRWRAAARAACLALKRKLAGARSDDAVAEFVADDEGVIAAAAAEALCREEAELPDSLAALLKPSETAAALGLYGIVLDSRDGTFLAHGGNPSFVGCTLEEVMRGAGLAQQDAPALLRRFRTAAHRVPGGSWVRYTWKAEVSEPAHIKGAHCSRLQLENPRREALAILCYGAPTSDAPADLQLPTPPPVAPSRSAVKAAALVLLEKLARADGAKAVHAVVNDLDGALATAAAEALGWEITHLPKDTLAGVQLAPL